MKLLEIRINSLFDHFNHVIELNKEEHITIITAPNGYGKTVVLKIINAIFNERFNFLLTLNFSSIDVKTDKSLFSIRRHGEDNAVILS